MRTLQASLILALVAASGWRCAAQQVPATPGDRTRTGSSPVATAVVAIAGGMVALADGATVAIPRGALQRSTTITLREAMPSTVRLPPGAVRVGKFYAIEPRLTSTDPIEITLPYQPTLLPAGYDEGSISIYQVRDDGRLSMVGSVTPDPTAESSGQALDVARHRVSIRVRSTATYTLVAVKLP